MARRNGVAGCDIIYNGPYKPGPALERAVKEGAWVNIDHYDELYLLERVAIEADTMLKVGIRVNMSTGSHPAWDRFGFNLDNGEAINAARRIRAGGRLVLAGLHCHIGTFVTDSAAYATAAHRLAGFAAGLERELGITMEVLDLGGGFASKNTLHTQYAPGEDVNPGMDDYAAAVAPEILAVNFPSGRHPRLILESGRALIDEAGTLITSVVANKKLPSGMRSVVVDAGVGVLFTAFWYRHSVSLGADKPGRPEDTVVYGPLCMNIDVLRPSVKLPPLDPGDPLLVHPVGAYNLTQWMQFIRMRPAVVLVGEKREVAVIRRAESIDAIKDYENVPEWLEKREKAKWRPKPHLVSAMAG